jgi:hypothetical protein
MFEVLFRVVFYTFCMFAGVVFTCDILMISQPILISWYGITAVQTIIWHLLPTAVISGVIGGVLLAILLQKLED